MHTQKQNGDTSACCFVLGGGQEQRLIRKEVVDAKNQMLRLEGLVMDVEGRLQNKLDTNGDKLDYAVNGIGLLVK